jgi:hypothetical protein
MRSIGKGRQEVRLVTGITIRLAEERLWTSPAAIIQRSERSEISAIALNGRFGTVTVNRNFGTLAGTWKNCDYTVKVYC